MSDLYSEKIRMCLEVGLISKSPSSPEMEMMLERFIHNYGSSYSSSSMFMKEEEVSASSDQEHQIQEEQAVFSGFCGVESDDWERKFGAGNGGLGNSDVNSDLIKQSSSPPYFFSHLPLENGFAAMRGGDRVDHQLNFSSGSPTCSGHLPRLAENGNDSWDNYSFNGLKRARDHNDLNMFSSSIASEIQENRDFGNFGGRGGLTHHLSLPKNFEMPCRAEKVWHFQNPVPCKMRAKRGFATHPRSIAERVRRTRITERMRRLEDLFPNIDKQTSIADKLELAVEYIKDLQKQVKIILGHQGELAISQQCWRLAH